MSRFQLFMLAAALAAGGVVCLVAGVSMLPDIRQHVAENYAAYSHGTDSTSYTCDGSPKEVADQLADYKRPEARASDRGSEYLRYDDDIVIVGPDGNRPCTIRVEDIRGRYSGGAFIFLGPGFYPGAPSGGAGGSPGGPGGGK